MKPGLDRADHLFLHFYQPPREGAAAVRLGVAQTVVQKNNGAHYMRPPPPPGPGET